MTVDQILVCVVLFVSLVLFIQGRYRYDLIAISALLALVLFGIVDPKLAFLGFGHPATITVAAVLILSQTLGDAGVTHYLGKYLTGFSNKPAWLILSLMTLVAGFSAIMNDVGALALVMPLALHLAQRYNISPSRLLMPIAFASLLGGLITLIGTPPNIIIASYRHSLGLPAFSMFDFTPVGIVVALVGILYVSILGWRFLPDRKTQNNAQAFEIDDYITEARLAKGSKFINQPLYHFEEAAKGQVTIVALLRGSRRILAPSHTEIIQEDDVLVLEGQPDNLNILQRTTHIIFNPNDDTGQKVVAQTSEHTETIEAVITPGGRLEGRRDQDLDLKESFGITLLAISRQGDTIRQRLSRVIFKAGDVLLLQGNRQSLPETLNLLGCLPLANRAIPQAHRARLLPAALTFLAAITVTALDILPSQISFSVAVVLLLIWRVIPLRRAYASIEGSIVVLIGSFITVGQALETTGAATVLSAILVEKMAGFPSWAVLGVLLMITMLLTDVINNSATAVIMAPIAVGVARSLECNIDPFLMAVAIGCSCTFLTPIGHHSNTLVMGPGGYHFKDYWRVGLLLDVLIVLTTVPMLMWVWPLN